MTIFFTFVIIKSYLDCVVLEQKVSILLKEDQLLTAKRTNKRKNSFNHE